MDMQIIDGATAGLAPMREGFNRGFRDYKYGTCFDAAGLRRFLARAGIDPADCAVLLVEEGGKSRGAGVAFLAVDGAEAWCGGLAVAPPHRRQGWAERLMEIVERRAVARGAGRLRLEVRAWNEAARGLYRKRGYREERELLVWERSPRQGVLPVPRERLVETDPACVLDEMYAWHDLTMPWQRRAAYLRRSLDRMTGLTIPAQDGAPVAYALVRHTLATDDEPERLHVLDIAVDPAANLLDAGRPLVQALQLRYRDATLCLVNEPVDSHLNRIFASFGFLVTERQYELVKDLCDE